MAVPRTRIAALAGSFALVGALIAGCGGSSPSSSGSPSSSTTIAAHAVTTPATTKGSGKPLKRPKTPDPCKLVTAKQAATALHLASVTSTEAPLGPTCIYLDPKHKQVATLSVQVINFAHDLKSMKQVTKTTIAGHKGYCGTLGSPMLLVALTHGEVLDVTAPCQAAEALAAVALSRISA
jgi:hypothetical protein